MNISREIKVGALAVLCIFLLFFGINYLKGKNIFNPIHSYYGKFVNIQGLTEQAPVYVRGYKVGQVEEIRYDFTQDTAFVVVVSLNRDIKVPEGSKIVLRPDGLLGGMAIEVDVPSGKDLPQMAIRSWLPTEVQLGLIDNLQANLLTTVDSTLNDLRALVNNVHSQLDGNNIPTILNNIEDLTGSLKKSSYNLENVIKNDVPIMVAKVDTVISDVEEVVANIQQADIAALVANADSTIATMHDLVSVVNTNEGTLGMLLHDNSLYLNINSTIVSADSLINLLNEQPSSIIWGKKKKKK